MLDYDLVGCMFECADQFGNLVVVCDLKCGICIEFHGLFVVYVRVFGFLVCFAFGFNVL